jgi:methyl-accepting chemotaxis protein
MNALRQLQRRLGALRIRTQLIAGFGIVLALTLTLGGASIWVLRTVYHEAQELSTKWLPMVSHLAQVRALQLELHDLEAKHARAADAGYMDDYETSMKIVNEKMREVITKLDAYDSGEEEGKLMAAVQKTQTDYEQTRKRIVSLSRDGKQDEAKEISDGAGNMASGDVIGAADRYSAYVFKAADQSAKDADALFQKGWIATVSIAALATLLGLALAFFITRRLVRQLGGEPAVAAQVAAAVAAGDLSSPIETRPGDEASLMAQLRNMQASLSTVVASVRQSSETLALASGEIAQGNADLSSRTEEQASSLQQTAASMEELGSTVRQNAGNAEQANKLAQQATQVAQRGGEVVNEVVETMKGINDSSRKIVDIISVIDSIAFQTNILALNAAVEAARAGEQGRGFAVVATEVRTLAHRSADAAKEIKSLISASVERVEQGSALVDRAGSTMTEVVGAIQRVTEIMGEISAASTQQSAGVSQVGEAVTRMDQTTQQNAALVEQSAAAAENLRAQAQQLVEAVAVFKLAQQARGHAF